MKQATALLLTTLFLFLLFGACQTPAEGTLSHFEAAPLLGMVYDAGNRPVSGAQLTIDGEPGPETGVNGRFVIPELERGHHMVVVEKAGHERLEVELEFISRTQVLYVRMTSLDHLLEEAERAIESRAYGAAKALLDRASALDPGNATVRYLSAIRAYVSEEHSRASTLLEEMIDDDLAAPHVHLLLADVYQHGLRDLEAAVRALESYLERQGDERVRERLNTLKERYEGENNE